MFPEEEVLLLMPFCAANTTLEDSAFNRPASQS